jgi:ABC-type branched-subunit amino acid transport system permease subunit
LAQNAFMGVGAYATARFVAGASDSWPQAVLYTTMGIAAIGVLIALPSARLRGAYFAAMTLALSLALPEAAYNWISETGGGNGKIVKSPTLGGTRLNGDQIYLVLATIAIIVFFALIALRNSPMGRRMVLASDAPRAARSLGLAPWWWQVAVLAIGGTLGGLAGSLSALQSGIVSPASFTLDLALLLFVATVIGGSVTGAFWGTAIVVLVPVAFKGIQEYSILMFGIALIVALIVLPRDMSGADVLNRRRPPGASARGSVPTDEAAPLTVIA